MGVDRRSRIRHRGSTRGEWAVVDLLHKSATPALVGVTESACPRPGQDNLNPSWAGGNRVRLVKTLQFELYASLVMKSISIKLSGTWKCGSASLPKYGTG